MHGTGPMVVLVVEDEALVRLALAACLRKVGVSFLEAATGEAAVELLAGRGRVDLMVTDINLGTDLSGWDVAKMLRAALGTA